MSFPHLCTSVFLFHIHWFLWNPKTRDLLIYMSFLNFSLVSKIRDSLTLMTLEFDCLVAFHAFRIFKILSKFGSVASQFWAKEDAKTYYKILGLGCSSKIGIGTWRISVGTRQKTSCKTSSKTRQSLWVFVTFHFDKIKILWYDFFITVPIFNIVT